MGPIDQRHPVEQFSLIAPPDLAEGRCLLHLFACQP
jgi:hypothetical protein